MFLFGLSPLEILAWVIAFVTALSVHEAAHAFTALYFGDPTAKFAGRTTLNPFKHLDPAGTIFMLFAGFGWGKPVPVNPHNFEHKTLGNFATAVAGPLANLATAFILALPYNFLFTPTSLIGQFIGITMHINIALMVFNLIPLFPLDGGNALAAILPPRAKEWMYAYGPWVLFGTIAADFAFHTRILASILGPAIDIVWVSINLATRFGS